MPRVTQFDVQDGVGTAAIVDVLVLMANAPARLPQMQFMMRRGEEVLARREGTVMLFQVILPGADPPDRATWAQGRDRLNAMRRGSATLSQCPSATTSDMRSFERCSALGEGPRSLSSGDSTLRRST